MAGPLGDLPGMTFDPIRNRYFPTPPVPAASAGPSRRSIQPRSSLGKNSTRKETDKRGFKRTLADGSKGYGRQHIVSTETPVERARITSRFSGTAGLPKSLSWKVGDVGGHRS